MFGPEERRRAVELYFTTPPATAQVVKHLGYPARQCLERWLAADPRYAGRMAKPIIPLETRTKAIELVLGGMQQKQAARQLGVSIGAVHNWVKAYREGGMAALQARNRNAAQNGKTASAPRRSRNAGDGNDDAEALRRRVEELELENALMREVVEVAEKDPGADLRRLSNREKTLPVDRPGPAYSPGSMTCLPAYRTGRPPTATTPGSASANTPDSGRRWRRRSPRPRAGTGTAGSRPCSEPASRRR